MQSPRIPLVPPLKCQGIKTKLTQDIAHLSGELPLGRWIEPFCGSLAVALNIQPRRALLSDANIHIIRFYQDIQTKTLDSTTIREYLREQGAKLKTNDGEYFYEVRERFNRQPNSFDFLFLNRACFNGLMRFNRQGKFNVPFCRKPERFSPAYITKIANQVATLAKILATSDWEFRISSFQGTLAAATAEDFVYADPPYAGRHVDYFNTWSEQDETQLAGLLAELPCRFILSTWHSNRFRENRLLAQHWHSARFHIQTRAHYYHVGATETLRHPMLEALITNYLPHCADPTQNTLSSSNPRNLYPCHTANP